MKKSERETLKKAFNIPEPERKESFVSLYNEKLKKNERKFNLPVFFRYTSTAVFAVLVIGLWGHLNKTADFRNKFNVSEPTETISTTTATQSLSYSEMTATESEQENVQTTHTTVSDTVQGTLPEIETPVTHEHLTMPDIPEFVPSVTSITFPTRTQSSTTHTIRTTTVKKTTMAKQTTTVTSVQTSADSEDIPPITEPPTDIPAVDTPPVDFVPSPPPETSPPATVPPPAVTTGQQTPSSSVNTPKDYTVSPVKVYSKSDNIIELPSKGSVEDDVNGFKPDLTIDDLINSSDYIIYGQIFNIIYTHVNGEPYTQADIMIRSVYKGSKLNRYDKISVYIPGGYMPAGEYERLNNIDISAPEGSSVYSSGGNRTNQIIGNIRMFFLKENSQNVPAGAFELTMKTDISIFMARGNEFISSGNNYLIFPKSLFDIN